MVLHLKIQIISHFCCSCCAVGVGCSGVEGDLTVAVLKVQLIADRKCQKFYLHLQLLFLTQLREKRKCFCFCKSVIKVKVWQEMPLAPQYHRRTKNKQNFPIIGKYEDAGKGDGRKRGLFMRPIGNPILLPPMQRVRLKPDDHHLLLPDKKTWISLCEDVKHSMGPCEAILLMQKLCNQVHGSSSHQTSSSFSQHLQFISRTLCGD